MAKVTLKQIAEKANTSKVAVSLVLNSKQYHRVSKETRARIEQVARELNYRPNLQAQSLALGRTNNIAVTVHSMTPFYQEYIRRLNKYFDEMGLIIFPFETYSDPQREDKVLKIINQGMFDGCICLEYNNGNRALYDSPVFQVPTICRGWNMLDSYPNNMLRINYRSSIDKLFAHLEAEGWRNLSIVADSMSKDESSPDPVRSSIYLDLLGKYNITSSDETWIKIPTATPDYMNYVFEKTIETISKYPDIDAMIVQNASEVPAVYKALRQCGKNIGQDIAVATFDRVPVLNYLEPAVTHIFEPADQIAEKLASGLQRLLKNNKEDVFDGSHEIATELAVMPSTLKR